MKTQYDSLGQVTSGKKFWADSTPIAGQQFGYAFDDIGNRQATSAGGDQWGANQRLAGYTANNLNQYTSRTVPGAVDILGLATNTATVTVNNIRAYRNGSYYRVELPVDNSAAPVYQFVTNLAVLNNGTNPDILTNVTGNIFLPQTPESFAYDADGNLTNDGRWSYTWDAENRLTAMAANTGVGPQISLKFEYDHRSRRIRKQVWSNTTWSGNSTNDLRFAYDGWKVKS